MTHTRREALVLTAGGLSLLAFAPAAWAATAEEAIAAFTGGAAAAAGGVEIKAPEIAENGNVVPVEVSAPGAASILLSAPGNPSAEVAKVTFGPKAGSQRISTRIRLSKTQDVTAVAQMADGSFAQ
ncbi:MAG TPA: thiosulfate oxidation carrier protein SoxY, partial [Rhodobacterales bacterium]|nr:thiosulfate oxidation carrier protein SoxY [Rhodobacterales bacterium]